MPFGDSQPQEYLAGRNGGHRLAGHDDLSQPGRDRQHATCGGSLHGPFRHLLQDDRSAGVQFGHRIAGHRHGGADPVDRLQRGRATLQQGFTARQFGLGIVQFRTGRRKARLSGRQLQFEFFVHDPGDDLPCLDLIPFGHVQRGDRSADPAAGRHDKAAFDLAEQGLRLGHLGGLQNDFPRRGKPRHGKKAQKGQEDAAWRNRHGGQLRIRRQNRWAVQAFGKSWQPGRSR